MPSEPRADRDRLSIPRVTRTATSALAQNWVAIGVITILLAWAPIEAWDLTPWSGLLHLTRPMDRWEAELIRTLAILPPGWLAGAAITALVVTKGRPRRRAIDAVVRAAGAFLTLLPYWLVGASTVWGELAAKGYLATRPQSWIKQHLSLALGVEQAAALVPAVLAFPFAMAVGILVPVVVAERPGFRASLGRCWSLLTGSRWIFLGLFLMAALTPLLIGLIPIVTWGVVTASLGQRGWGHSKQYFEGLFLLAEYFGTAVGSVLIAAAYLELRRLHDGPEPDELHEVFA
jgi:hypothetical protein